VPTYQQLNQRHPSCNPARERVLAALYEGGEKLEALHCELLPQRPRERSQRYETRLKEAEYRNYLGPIIDYFKSMLFVSRPVLKAKSEGDDEASDPGGYWNQLREDCDGGGTDLDALFGQMLTDAMIQRTAWVRLHIPGDGGDAPTDLAAYEARKLGDAWLERLEPGCLLDWEADEAGRLRWAITHETERRRIGIADMRKHVVETWEYLTPESVETYRLEYDVDKPPQPEQEVPRVANDPNRFGAVPLVCLDLPIGLWVANRLKSPQLAMLRKVSALAWSLSATAFAMPVAKVNDPEQFMSQVTGSGYEIVIRRDEEWGWEAPPTGHFEALDREIKTTKDELFRIAHQMALGVENNAAAIGRTADSKASDNEITRVVLVSFSRLVKEAIERALDLISRARGEKLTWSVEGLDDFASFDIGAFLTQLGLVEAAGGIPSNIFKAQSKIRVAESMLKDVDESTKALMRQQITEGVENEPDEIDKEIERTVRMHEALSEADVDEPDGAGARAGADAQKAPAGRGNRAAVSARAKKRSN
jgi:hypothetical protein